MAKIYEEFKIRITDVNSKFICANKSILSILENVACTHSDLAGYGANNILTTRVTWVLINWKVKILKRPKYADVVKVETWARNTGKITTHRDFKMYSQDGEILCIASSKWALIDIDKGLTKINDLINESYSPENERVFNDVELKKLTPPTNCEKSFDYAVTRKDLDVNQHVHNLNYLDYAYELLDDESYYDEFNNIEIYYKAESKLGDILTVSLSCENGCVFSIKNKLTDNLIAVIKLS